MSSPTGEGQRQLSGGRVWYGLARGDGQDCPSYNGSGPLTPALSPTAESSPQAVPNVGEREQRGRSPAKERMRPAKSECE